MLSGRDAQQNEQLVKKYLRTGDAYVHADMHGASSCIVRCKVKKDPVTGSETPLPISPFALNEAGTMTICRSGAWSVKVVMSAWWVSAGQVSKTAPTGEYLSTGSFMIYGKKNYLPPTSLEMGFGVLFRLDDGSVSRHLTERVDKSINVGGGGGGDTSVGVPGSAEDSTGGVDLKSATAQSSSSSLESDVKKAPASGEAGEKDKKKPRKTKAQRQAESAALKEQQGEEEEEEEGDNDRECDDSTTSGKEKSQNEEVIVDITDSAAAVVIEEKSCAEGLDSVEEKEQTKQKGSSGKAKLTPYQRKMLKKGKTLEEIEQMQSDKQKEKDEQEQAAALREKEAEENHEGGADDKAEVAPQSANNTGKKKKLSKKKARRYADQDDEDMRLAMRALGHGHKLGVGGEEGEGDEGEDVATSKSFQEKSKKQEKAGIHLLQATWEAAMAGLSGEVRAQLDKLVSKKLLKESELDPFELTTLGTFSADEGLEILALFDCDNCTGIGNKSGFLAGIMRRFSKNKEKALVKQRQQASQLEKAAAEEEVTSQDEGGEGQETSTSSNTSSGASISRGERKKVEAQEIQLILQEEGVLDEQEGRLADELEKLSGAPLPEDVLLYALPVCGPFAGMVCVLWTE